jgi:hypothetical protein
MSENPIFYSSIIPLDRERHRNLRLKSDAGQYAFAAKTHVIPALVDEFPAACRQLPIVFLTAAQKPSSVFLVGLRAGHNAFVTEQGNWVDGYVPAFVRRYPFMLGETAEGGALACIDEKYKGLNGKTGERLFAEDGGETPFLKDRIKFMNDYLQSANKTTLFLRRLDELQLFRSVNIESKVEGGASAVFHGFMTIDEAKLNALSDADFLRLRAEGLLPAIYAHLISLASVSRLQQLYAAA